MKINKKLLFSILLVVILVLPVLVLPSMTYAADEGFCRMVKRVKELTYQIGGTLVVIGWIIAGILYLTAVGSPEKTGLAKKAMIAAVIGTALVIIAGSASTIVMDALGYTTGAVPICP